MTEKLRPCPFCGKPGVILNTDKYIEFDCSCVLSDDSYYNCTLTDVWNNAYCWKKHDRLVAELDALRAENEKLETENKKLKSVGDEMAETLKKINRSCSGDAVVYSRIALEKYEAMKGNKDVSKG